MLINRWVKLCNVAWLMRFFWDCAVCCGWIPEDFKLQFVILVYNSKVWEIRWCCLFSSKLLRFWLAYLLIILFFTILCRVALYISSFDFYSIPLNSYAWRWNPMITLGYFLSTECFTQAFHFFLTFQLAIHMAFSSFHFLCIVGNHVERLNGNQPCPSRTLAVLLFYISHRISFLFSFLFSLFYLYLFCLFWFHWFSYYSSHLSKKLHAACMQLVCVWFLVWSLGQCTVLVRFLNVSFHWN